MRYAAALGQRHLAGADIHAAVELVRVGVHDLHGDLAAESVRNLDR